MREGFSSFSISERGGRCARVEPGFPPKLPRKLHTEVTIHLMKMTWACGFLFVKRRSCWNTLPVRPRVKGARERRILITVLALWVSLGAPWAVRAQVAGGSITGTVRGESGAAMPGVRVSITDATSSAAR